MAKFFPGAATVVCSHHLRENICRKLDSLLGAKSPTRPQLYAALYGAIGIMTCNDIISIDDAIDKCVKLSSQVNLQSFL
jgi:hypothetical protein